MEEDRKAIITQDKCEGITNYEEMKRLCLITRQFLEKRKN